MPQQLTFDLPAIPAQSREDFLVSPANALAVQMLEGWHDWPAHKLVLIGPGGSGKTHLVQVWAAMTGASVLNARDLAGADIEQLAQSPLAIEDVPDIRVDDTAQEALFHLHNLAQSHTSPLLLTATKAPARWHMTLPDLQSRMAATAITTLEAPDDALLSAVMVKLFADRQIEVAPKLITYLLKRMTRSFDAAGTLVAALDQAALSEGRAISRKIAAQVLDKLTQNGS